MMKRSKTGRILHTERPFSPHRPLHITMKVADDVPSLRRPEIHDAFLDILHKAKERGLKYLSHSLMDDHIHLFGMVGNREALADVMRFLMSQLARAINRIFGRRGSVFPERYWSTLCESVKQAWTALGYILRNPFKGYRLRRNREGFDRYSGVDEAALLSNRFLRSFLEMPRRDFRDLLRRMVTDRLPFVPLRNRLQPRLL